MNTKKKSMLLGILFLVALLLGSTLVSKAYVVLGTVSPSNSSLSPSVAEDKQLVFRYLIGNARTPAFKRGEKILVIFENYENSSVELPNDAPW
ncbi:MAG: hypothetical protein J7L47_01570 [Candidatus Odinarchaeota archaeon]|nr:hypothetical protein [Candidatus Odinarchaeota archaeon]